jgi:hypothetical protein
MREGTAPLERDKQSTESRKESTATWSKRKRGRRVRHDKEDPSCTE